MLHGQQTLWRHPVQFLVGITGDHHWQIFLPLAVLNDSLLIHMQSST
jgi:hypothetical protein